LTIILILCSTTIVISQKSVLAQIENDFLTYQNDEFGFKIQHPLNWTKYDEFDFSGKMGEISVNALQDTGVGRPIVDFCPPPIIKPPSSLSPCLLTAFHSSVIDISLRVSVFDQLKKSEKSLDGFTEKRISQIISPHNKIIQSIPITLGGNLGHMIKLVFQNAFSRNPHEEQRIEVWTIHDNKVYDIAFNSPTSLNQISLAQKMIDSFQFTK